MTQIVQFKESAIQDLYKQVEDNHHNPSAAFYAAVDALETITDVKLLDPTNPTVFLLESASIASSAAINESVALLRQTYPRLAENYEDLNNHVSDWDLLNRFASPCEEPIGFLFGLDALLKDMVRDESESCIKAVIPRDTEVKVGTITFTLMYPIVLRYYDTGSFSVSYDATELSNFQTIETNIINFEIRKMPEGARFLYFQVPMLQVKIDSVTTTNQQGRVTVLEHYLEDQFYFARAFIRNNDTNNKWKEIKTTHSQLTYDRREITLLLTVSENVVRATLPLVYMQEYNLLGEIKLVVYTTKGNIVENLVPYETSIELRAIDTDKDLTIYTTQALANVPRIAIATSTTTGGKNGLSFEEYREQVIFNSTGPQQLPITQNQIKASANTKNFELIKNVDMVTDRVFLALQKLPNPTNPRLITPTNVGIETLVIEGSQLESHPYVKVNNNRWTILPKCLFNQNNGLLKLLSNTEMSNLLMMERTAFVRHLNENKYLYTPFHWVLDNNFEEFSARPYYLDNPKPSTINFISQNETLQLVVNTATRLFTKEDYGYKLQITTLSGEHYKNLPDYQVGAQLMFYPDNETVPVYILGTLIGTNSNRERVYEFHIETNYDLDEDHRLKITNGFIEANSNQEVWINLNAEFHIFIGTSSLVNNYLPNEASGLFGDFQFEQRFVPVTHESLKVELGRPLTNLWARARSLATGYNYETYSENVQMTYSEDVYEIDPITGKSFSIVNGVPVFNIKHHRGDLVFDQNNNPVYAYLKDQPIIDPETKLPKLKSLKSELKEVDLLFIDGRNYFVTDEASKAYNQELVDVLLSWITEDLATIKDKLLEKTKIYYYPKTQIGLCTVDRGDGINITIDAEQTPTLDLYVPLTVFESTTIREQLKNKAIVILDTMLSGREINSSSIEKALVETFGNAVLSVKLYGLGDHNNELHYARVITPTRSLSLKREIVMQADGTFIVKEAVKINFIRIEDTMK